MAKEDYVKTFEECWDFIVKRSADKNFPVVQNKHELMEVFSLMKGCSSYLEVGSAEGNSLYVLAHALKEGAHITYIDWDEPHTRDSRNEVVKLLTDEGYKIQPVIGNTQHREVIELAQLNDYECIMIDAGHAFYDVMCDASNYMPFASKYVFFHDIMLPDVGDAFAIRTRGMKTRRIIHSNNFGYGVVEV